MSLNKLLTRQINKYIPEDLRDNPAFDRFIQAVSESYDSYEKDLDLSNRTFSISEQEYKQLTEMMKHKSHTGEVTGTSTSPNNATQNKPELVLPEARDSEEESAAVKEIFLANMNHEIRTPMNAIIGMGRQLQRTLLNEQQQFYLETINKAAEHLLVVINEILDTPKTKGKRIDSSILMEKKILLVEDNEINRLVASTLLENYGVTIVEVHNGAEAVHALKTGHFDLVLMDVQMPVLNGLDATRIIRQEVNQFVPIIALTANAIRGEAEKCLKAGMNDHISKPFEEEELINAMARWLGEKSESFANIQSSDMEKTPVTRLYDLKKLENIAQNNKQFILKMVTLFTKQAPADVTEIETAFEQQQLTVLKSVAHRMKPSIDNLDIQPLHSLIREIELYKEAETPLPQLKNKIHELRQTIDQVVIQLKNEILEAGE